MKMQITLENGDEKITNLSIANAIIELCDDSYIQLDPSIIAKAILLETKNEATENEN